MRGRRRFTISGWFEADDIDDAFEWLAQHFQTLADDGDDDEARPCDLLVRPVGTPE